MKKNESQHSKNNIQLAVLFCLLVVGLIGVSLLFKLGVVVSESIFDGNHRFTVAVIKNPALILSFSPNNQSISVLEVASKKGISELSKNQLAQYLKIPIDAELHLEKIDQKKHFQYQTIDELANNKKLAAELIQLIIRHNKLETKMTFVDHARLAFFSNSVSSNNITTSEITNKLDPFSVDKISSSLFEDADISSEKASLSIINGTDISGLGGRFERLVSNMGGNVVSISTSEKPFRLSEIIYSKEDSYTVSKLEKITGFPLIKRNKDGIYDVIIRLGTDQKYKSF